MEWLVQRFELTRGGSSSNVRPMEGLRGFAVFLVFLVHYVTLVSPWIAALPSLTSFANALHTIGNVGVDLFFVLSGLLIYGSLISRQQEFSHFMARRILRIYPAFLVVFAVYVTLSFVFPEQNKIPSPASSGLVYLLYNILLLPGLFAIEPMITVAWSLSYEMFYYLTLPLAISLLRLRDRSVIWRCSFFLCLTISTAAYCAIFGGPIRLIMFVDGILLYEVISDTRIRTPSSYIGLIALVLGILSTLLPIAGTSGLFLKVIILFASFFLLCLTCFRNTTGWLSNLFSWTPLRWLGNMSYSYYLVHGLTLKASFLVLGKISPAAGNGSLLFFGLLPVMFAITLIPSAFLYLIVERPLSLAAGKDAKIAR